MCRDITYYSRGGGGEIYVGGVRGLFPHGLLALQNKFKKEDVYFKRMSFFFLGSTAPKCLDPSCSMFTRSYCAQ